MVRRSAPIRHANTGRGALLTAFFRDRKMWEGSRISMGMVVLRNRSLTGPDGTRICEGACMFMFFFCSRLCFGCFFRSFSLCLPPCSVPRRVERDINPANSFDCCFRFARQSGGVMYRFLLHFYFPAFGFAPTNGSSARGRGMVPSSFRGKSSSVCCTNTAPRQRVAADGLERFIREAHLTATRTEQGTPGEVL